MINQRIIRSFAALAVIGFAFVFTSCGNEVVFSKYHTFDNNEWFAKDKVTFDLEITDTKNLNNILFKIRHADAYPYSNIFLFVTTSYPDGKVMTDTMEIMLANNKGEWMGSGAGDIFDFEVPVKKNVKFPLGGKYKFEFVQGMREDPLPFIMDLGLEIEKSK
ncbi:MAG TPA: gliding motility lipoprotein GldH [Bacteroidia bacterium]|nr:gliding motility lipoprotein GldH [Bacteroidia bacterium]